MQTKPSPSTTVAELRHLAEARLRKQRKNQSLKAGDAESDADPQRLLHELQVHQIELEMQNEELKKARDETEAGLEKYSDLYDFAPAGYFTLAADGTIRLVNLSGAHLVGIERSRLVGRRFGLLVSEELRPVFNSFLKRIFASLTKQSGDFELLSNGQPPRMVNIIAQRLFNGQECRVAVVDITERKQAEAATAQLAAIVESSSDAIVAKDLNGIITSWNGGAEKIFGYSAGEMVGRPISRLIPSDRLPEEAQIMSRIRQGKSMEHIETVRVAKDGRLLDMSITVSPIRYLTGKIIGASKVARDITGRKRVEDAVRVSEIRYRRLFEAAHDGVLVLDPGTRKITDANPFMTKLLGYPHAQLVGKELFEIGLLKDETASQEMFRKLKRKHEIRYEDLPLKSQGGRHQEVEVVANLYQENGHSVIQCNIRDITARKQAEEAQRSVEVMTASNRKLEQEIVQRLAVEKSLKQTEQHQRRLLEQSHLMQDKLRDLSRQVLLAQEEERKRISRELHDVIAQTLTGINVRLATLKKEAGLDIKGFDRNIARTQRLVEKSVDIVHQFARELRPAVLDDLGLIPALHSFVRLFSNRTCLHVHLKAFAGVEQLDFAKRTVLYRVVQESLTNVARHAKASRAEVSIEKLPDGIGMKIKDDGKSFSVERQLHAKGSKRLGLLGMRERVEMVGGTFCVESAPGQGTTIQVEIPFAKCGKPC
jgi:PAS domain S-box-containing protein